MSEAQIEYPIMDSSNIGCCIEFHHPSVIHMAEGYFENNPLFVTEGRDLKVVVDSATVISRLLKEEEDAS